MNNQTNVGGFHLDDKVTYSRKDGKEKQGTIASLLLYGREFSNHDELSISIRWASIPQIQFNRYKNKFFTTDGNEIIIHKQIGY